MHVNWHVKWFRPTCKSCSTLLFRRTVDDIPGNGKSERETMCNLA
jgi:hypothetical protein